jgi:hypothetical protein
LVEVAVQRHGRERGDPPLLAPQERAPQQRGVRSYRWGPALDVVAPGQGGADLGLRTPVVLLAAPGGEQPVQLGQRGDHGPPASIDLDKELPAHGAVPAFCFPGRLRTSWMSGTAADHTS